MRRIFAVWDKEKQEYIWSENCFVTYLDEAEFRSLVAREVSPKNFIMRATYLRAVLPYLEKLLGAMEKTSQFFQEEREK